MGESGQSCACSLLTIKGKTAFQESSEYAHDCRHAFGTRLVHRGVDPITVKDLLGHSTAKVMERCTHSTSDSNPSGRALLSLEKSATSSILAEFLREKWFLRKTHFGNGNYWLAINSLFMKNKPEEKKISFSAVADDRPNRSGTGTR